MPHGGPGRAGGDAVPAEVRAQGVEGGVDVDSPAPLSVVRTGMTSPAQGLGIPGRPVQRRCSPWVEFGSTVRSDHPIWPPVASAQFRPCGFRRSRVSKHLTSQGTARPQVTCSLPKWPEWDS